MTLSWSSRLLFGAETTASSTVAAAVAAAELDGPVFLDGGRLRAIRADRGIADGALRKAAGCPLSTWRALLTGQVPADVALVQLLVPHARHRAGRADGRVAP